MRLGRGFVSLRSTLLLCKCDLASPISLGTTSTSSIFISIIHFGGLNFCGKEGHSQTEVRSIQVDQYNAPCNILVQLLRILPLGVMLRRQSS